MEKTSNSDKKYLFYILLISLLSSTALISFLIISNYPPGTINLDERGYIEVTDYFMGKDIEVFKQRTLRPIVPILVIPFSYLFGTKASFLILNSILFVLLCESFFLLSKLLLKKSNLAFLSTLLLIFAFPIYYRGINVGVDLAYWTIFIIMSILIIRYKKKKDMNTLNFGILSFFCGVSMLVMEFSLIAFLFLIITFISEKIKRERLHKVILNLVIFSILFAIPLLIFQFLNQYIFDYTILDKILYDKELALQNMINLGLPGFIKSFIGAFLASLFFFPFGVIKIFKNKENITIYTTMLISIIPILSLVNIHTIRYVFILFPIIFPVTIIGTSYLADILQNKLQFNNKFKSYLIASFILMIIIVNILTYIAIIHFGSTDKIAEALLII